MRLFPFLHRETWNLLRFGVCSALLDSDRCSADHDLGILTTPLRRSRFLLRSVSPLRFLVGSPPWPSELYRFCPFVACHGGHAGWIPVAAGYPPRHRAGQFMGDFDRLGNFVLYSVCSLSEMIPDENLIGLNV